MVFVFGKKRRQDLPAEECVRPEVAVYAVDWADGAQKKVLTRDKRTCRDRLVFGVVKSRESPQIFGGEGKMGRAKGRVKSPSARISHSTVSGHSNISQSPGTLPRQYPTGRVSSPSIQGFDEKKN